MTAPDRNAARLSGGCVGAFSGAVAVAAHGAGGGALPTENSLVVLVLACSVIGAVVATAMPLGRRLPMLVGQLCAGQLIGHCTLAITAEHVHGMHLSPLMVASHVAAAFACAVLIFTAERLYVLAESAFDQIVVLFSPPQPIEPPSTLGPPDYRLDVGLRLLVSSGLGTRGPPNSASAA